MAGLRGAILALNLISVSAALAQSGGSVYTQTNLNVIQRRNSAANFSTQQIKSNLYRRTVPQYAYNTLNRNLFSSQLNGGQKPFSGVQRGGVSPYLGLSAPFSSTAEQYYTQVRPQLQQQRAAQQQAQRAALIQQQRMNDIAAQQPYDPTGSETMMPTGHQTVFQNYGGYYPDPPQRK